MKPIKLTMSAFGPYAKEQVIDFTELNQQRLFLITGPTGAGKTTIFDGISYALYGESSGSGEMRTTDTLRSHFASPEDLTEVTLEFVLKSKRYVVSRKPKQYRNKARGEGQTEQKPEASLMIYSSLNPDDDEPQVVTGIGEVSDKIEQIMGVNSEQFKQIMMIPQGEFRKLLVAGSADREKVLNQLFDTAIYGLIQKQLDLKSKSCITALDELTKKKGYIINKVIPSDDEAHILNMAISNQPIDIEQVLTGLSHLTKTDTEKIGVLNSQLSEKVGELKSVFEKKSKADNMNQLIEAHEGYEKALTTALEQKDIYETEAIVIELAQKAEAIKPIENQLIQQKKIAEEKTAELGRINLELEETRSAYKKYQTQLESANSPENQKVLNDLKQTIMKYEDLIEKVELLADLNDQKYKKEVLIKQYEEGRNLAGEQLLKIKETQKAKKTSLELMADIDKKLNGLLIRIGEQKSIVESFRQVNDAIIETEKYEVILQEEKDILTQKDTAYKKADQELKQLQHDYYLNQAAILAKELVIQEPCPVCGSLDHPNPAKASTVLISKEAIDRGEEKRHIAMEAVSSASTRYEKTKERVSILEQEIEKSLTKLTTQDIVKEVISREIVSKLFDEQQGIFIELQEEAAICRKDLEQRASTEEAIRNLEQEILAVEEQLEKSQIEETKITSEHQLLLGQIQGLEKDIPVLLRNPSTLRDEIYDRKGQLENLENGFKSLQENVNHYHGLVIKLETMRNGLSQDIKHLEDDIKTVSIEFTDRIKKEGFESPEDYHHAKRERNDRLALEERQKSYQQRLVQLKQTITDSQARIQGRSYEDVAHYQESIIEIEKEQQALQERINIHKNRINNNDHVTKELKAIKVDMKAIEADYAVVGKISQVANGTYKYKITFERYVLAQILNDITNAATTRLLKMTAGRFLLRRAIDIRDGRKASGLDLEVFDQNTGQARPVTSLSGGEMFKASLSMALGLSDVVQSYSGGVQLDTMFIDEGFGTLDSESLDQAITCLIDLQKMGRTIGIISHVPELKERISAQLQVEMSNVGSKAKFVV